MKLNNKIYVTVLIVSSLFLINSCEKSELLPEIEKIVVQAYLYTGEPVDDIKISWLNSYANEDTIYQPVNNAEVTISGNDRKYDLELFPGDSGYYYYPGNLPVISGNEYFLEVKVNQYEITASTIVPETPPETKISDSILHVKQVEDFYDMMEMEWPDPIDITWDNPSQEYFFLVVENIEEDPEYILSFMEEETIFPNRKFSMTTEPTQMNFYQIQTRSLTYFGKYLVKFFRVNEEYARLYETIEQDSRDLNEPYSNVNNGLGIFTAFTGDSLYFEVKEKL